MLDQIIIKKTFVVTCPNTDEKMKYALEHEIPNDMFAKRLSTDTELMAYLSKEYNKYMDDPDQLTVYSTEEFAEMLNSGDFATYKNFVGFIETESKANTIEYIIKEIDNDNMVTINGCQVIRYSHTDENFFFTFLVETSFEKSCEFKEIAVKRNTPIAIHEDGIYAHVNGRKVEKNKYFLSEVYVFHVYSPKKIEKSVK